MKKRVVSFFVCGVFTFSLMGMNNKQSKGVYEKISSDVFAHHIMMFLPIDNRFFKCMASPEQFVKKDILAQALVCKYKKQPLRIRLYRKVGVGFNSTNVSADKLRVRHKYEDSYKTKDVVVKTLDWFERHASRLKDFLARTQIKFVLILDFFKNGKNDSLYASGWMTRDDNSTKISDLTTLQELICFDCMISIDFSKYTSLQKIVFVNWSITPESFSSFVSSEAIQENLREIRIYEYKEARETFRSKVISGLKSFEKRSQVKFDFSHP